MGPEHADLLASWEHYFNIKISPDDVREIKTVQHAVDYISGQLKLSAKTSPLESGLKKRIEKALKDTGVASEYLNSSTQIFQILHPEDEAKWNMFCKHLQLEVPRPSIGTKDSWGNKFLNILYSRQAHWKTTTLDHFVHVITAANYKSLILKDSIHSVSEVSAIITALTANICRIDYYDVLPEKKYGSDI